MVKIKPFTATPEAVAAYGPVWLEDGRRLKVEVKSMAKGLVLARLDGIASREDAEAIKGMSLYIARDALPETATDEVYQIDLIGCSVDATGSVSLAR